MKKILILLFTVSASAQAQVTTYDYLYFCDKVMTDTDNSIQCLNRLYLDLKEYKKSPGSSRLRYFDSYNCIRQPDEKAYDKIKNGPTSLFKTVDTELWKLYNDCYTKNGEIIAYIRLEDYKTDLDKGFALIKEMQQLQIAIGKARDQIATKVANDAKAVPVNSYQKPYQMLLKAIVHEEYLIRKLSQNFNEGTFIGYPKEEILKSYLEGDNLLKEIDATKFTVTEPAFLKSCIEGLRLIQETKQHSLDRFNNSSTFDGQYLNTLYDNLQNYFNNDILDFFAHFCGQARLHYYPTTLRQSDLDSPAKPWALEHLHYTPVSLDTLTIAKQPAPLPAEGFNELNDIAYYIDECVLSMSSLYKELRQEEYTWNNIRNGKMPYKNPVLKFDRFMIPVSLHGMILKESNHIPAQYRKGLVDQVNDVQEIMLSIQDNLIELSTYISNGTFRTKGMEYLDPEIMKLEMLYNELDARKERLFLQTRKVYAAYPPRKLNSWTTSGTALLKATDDSRRILRQMELRVYENNSSPISTAAIHEDQRDLIINEQKYMKGIVRLGMNNGLSASNPYEYIPGYLKTLEEKINALPATDKDKDKAYGDILYMHNIVVEQYNKYAQIALNDDEDAVADPMRPVYILLYTRQPPKYHYEIPRPEEKQPEIPKEPEPVVIPPPDISFEGYAFNNLVLLLDVSASMDKPDRLPLLKNSFQELVRHMRKEDEVSIVIYSGKATLHLPPVSASDTTSIMKAIASLKSEGKTNILDGVELAYKTANKNFIENGNNKIIMATDGEFNTGEPLYKLVEKNANKIALSVFDFSQVEQPLKALQQLAGKGNGNYVKVTWGNALEVLAGEARKK